MATAIGKPLAPGPRFYDKPVGMLDFVDTRHGHESKERIHLWDNEIFKIGRDPRSNNFAIETDAGNMVSRNHCEIYVIVYEQFVNHVYVRDRKSINGTYVNNILVGAGPQLSSGYLLEDGDAIEIRPYWKFIFCHTTKPFRHDLTAIQAEECQLFEDKYQLSNRCLGQGAEAFVYLAVDTSTKKQLVCKLVNLDKLQGSRHSRKNLQRKFQEADILRQLQHPNILSYVDAIISPHSLYTFTELASGGDLMSYLLRHDHVPEFDTRILLRQVVRGLGYLHSKGIVHRDLKPENLLLACSPKIAYHRVMLSDFGVSAVPRRSRMITMVGTDNYQAPEFLTLSRTGVHTAAVDVWSLGVVALLLVAATNHPEALNRLDQRPLDRYLKKCFSICKPQPSSNAKNFIWGCLRVSPGDRISTTEAECHDWLCTPQKHLEFFRRLDQRMKTDWCIENHVKPMPLELQC